MIQKEISVHRQRDVLEFEQYLYEKEHATATIKKYITDVKTFFKFLEGDVQIDKRKVLEYKEWLCNHYATTSVNSMLVALNQFLEFLGASLLKVKQLKIQKQLFMAEEKEMTKEEYRRLVQAAYQQNNSQLALGIETLAATGARISELSFFTVESIRKGMVEISNKGKNRIILIPDYLKKKLLWYTSKHAITKGSIFITKSGKAKDRSNFWREMKRLRESADVAEKKIFPHNLRHLFARLFYKETKDLAGLADLLGHSSLDVTRIYTATSSKAYKRLIEKLGILTE